MTNANYGTHPGQIAGLLTSLNDEERSRIRILTADENSTVQLASLDRLAHTRKGQIDWDSVPAIERYMAQDDAHASRLISELLVRYISDASEVIALWGNLSIPSISLSAASAARNSGEVIAVSYDLWLYAPVEGIILEYFHDGGIGVARV